MSSKLVLVLNCGSSSLKLQLLMQLMVMNTFLV